MPCSQYIGCQNNQHCEAHGTYFNNYSNSVNCSPICAVSSASGLLATHGPNTPFPSAQFESVIENYMRNMLRPEVFTKPPQSMSPPPQTEGSMSASFWDDNIDPNLPPLNPVTYQAECRPAGDQSP
ncbi:uncharacterized protein N7496_006977 [Penicillium cataractarum]|uniref:Uncharacterized protein n=1 Tax=Penicillium cataractarum TaxID=2100454 RepID=A0A9W9V927_9EURO|nr:uncharacterized protein N7496_006977 [Penicillium cataractarum]KAJ5370885.1 hypothetical protein N7496_006977 [Penicillium cataractarum]